MLFGEWIMNKIKIKLLTKTFSLLLIIMGIFLLFSLFNCYVYKNEIYTNCLSQASYYVESLESQL